MAALARADRVPVALPPLELVVLLQPGDDALVGLGLGQAGELAGRLVHPAVRADHGERRQPVVGADREVERVVPGRDLERARAEPELDALVGDHGHAAPDERHDHLLADRVPVALVLRVHGHRDVGEHRRGPHRRDRQAAGAVPEGVAGVRQRVVDLHVLHLKVGDRGLVEGAPVDEPVRAIEPPALREVDEEAHHRLDVSPRPS